MEKKSEYYRIKWVAQQYIPRPDRLNSCVRSIWKYFRLRDLHETGLSGLFTSGIGDITNEVRLWSLWTRIKQNPRRPKTYAAYRMHQTFRVR